MKSLGTVYVGLSGGVDSSVAALRLKRAGYNVVGVFIKVWHPDFMVCNWEQERLDAMRVAAHLDIPFLTCDAVEDYKNEVADYFITEYIAGRTPNPDVMCNKAVKFGAFMRFAMSRGADFIATGHYAQNIDNELHRGLDTNKDQTYFLWTLSNEQIAKTLFPVGNTTKEKIRKEALAAKIPTALKKDSQGICFLGHVDIPEFISHYTELVPGEVLNQAGDVIGTHQGALVYTTGQRHGFELTDSNSSRTGMFVISKNLAKNTITVSPDCLQVGKDDMVTLHSLQLRKPIVEGSSYEVQFRYRQEPVLVKVHSVDMDSLTISVVSDTDKPAAGQSCVIYQGSHCLGGGIIA